MVSNFYWNGDNESEAIFKVLIEISGVPDLTMFLHPTPKTRTKRLKMRDKNDCDLSDADKKDDGYQKMIYFLDKFNLPYVFINTENRTLDEIKQDVDIEIFKLKNKLDVL